MQNQLLLTFNNTEKMDAFLAFIQHLEFIENIEKLDKEQNIDLEESLVIAPIAPPKDADYCVEEIEHFALQFPENYIWKAKHIEEYFPKDLKISVQIIQNQLLIMASPNDIHQQISMELSASMHFFVKQNKLGKVLTAPMDTILNEDNLVQPDILFIAITRYDIVEDGKIKGAPDMVIEIWSPANSKKERDAKHSLYENSQITEYWQIFPKKQKVIIETLNEHGKYEIFS
jgi:Uma2 family endonuclease